MAEIKVSSNVEEAVWEELKQYSAETHRNLSELLTEAIREFLQRGRVRPGVLEHLRRSIEETRERGDRLAR